MDLNIALGGFEVGGLSNAIGSSGAIGGSGALAVGAQFGMIVQGIKAITDIVKRMLDKLSEISPVLKGSLDIAKRSFQLVLKPFADALGSVLLPLSKVLLKLAVKWVKFWRGKEDILGEGLKETIAGLLIGPEFITLKSIWDIIETPEKSIWKFLTGETKSIWQFIKTETKPLWKFIVTETKSIWNYLTIEPRSIWNFITGEAKSIWEFITGGDTEETVNSTTYPSTPENIGNTGGGVNVSTGGGQSIATPATVTRTTTGGTSVTTTTNTSKRTSDNEERWDLWNENVKDEYKSYFGGGG